MLHQTTSPARKDQGWFDRAAMVVAICSVTACGRAEATPEIAVADSPTATFATQPVEADPCSWLTPAEVSATLGRQLRGVPVRVSSAESVTPSATGSGCLYELEPPPGQDAGMVSIEVKVDGVEMQAGLGAAAMGAFASATGRWTAEWDWVSALPAGLFAARQGHVGILIAINAASLSPRDVEPLGAKLLAKVPDIPFANAPSDPGVRGSGTNPCSILTRAEAETVVGPLTLDPFRSRESSAIAHGDGESCTYYTAGHHVVVLTPTWTDGRTVFGMLKGIGGLVRTMTGDQAITSSKAAWDDRASGVAGSLLFLKGDRMLEVQHRGSRADDGAAMRLATIALGRM